MNGKIFERKINMNYRPPVVTRNTLKGKAKVQAGKIKGKDVLGVTFEDNTDVTYTILRNDAPKYATAGIFYVRLSQDKTKIDSMSPLNGSFHVKTDTFPAKEGEKPAPYVVTNLKYKTSSEKFNVVLEVLGPKYAGMSILMILPYYWFDVAKEEVPGKGLKDVLALVEPRKASPGHRSLKNYLDVSGAWAGGPIPFSDNVLPALQQRILRAAKEFDVVLENGFVNTIILEDAEEDFADKKAPAIWGDEEPETPETKKPTEVTESETSWGEPTESEDFDGKGSPIIPDDPDTYGDSAPWDNM